MCEFKHAMVIQLYVAQPVSGYCVLVIVQSCCCLLMSLCVLCRLLPGVEDVAQNVADPECRSVASKAHATLLKVGADGKVTGIVANEAEVLAQLGSAIANSNCQVAEIPTKYAASLICGLINASQYKEEQWFKVCCPVIIPMSSWDMKHCEGAVCSNRN